LVADKPVNCIKIGRSFSARCLALSRSAMD
jgi:hypothetical protein